MVGWRLVPRVRGSTRVVKVRVQELIAKEVVLKVWEVAGLSTARSDNHAAMEVVKFEV